jgi:hypothetical protein
MYFASCPSVVPLFEADLSFVFRYSNQVCNEPVVESVVEQTFENKNAVSNESAVKQTYDGLQLAAKALQGGPSATDLTELLSNVNTPKTEQAIIAANLVKDRSAAATAALSNLRNGN